MDDDQLEQDIGLPLAGDDDMPHELSSEPDDDLDDNFDRELREAEQDLEATDPPVKKPYEADEEE